MKFIMQMYDHIIQPLTLSDIITRLVGKEFTAAAIVNIGKKEQQAINIAEGIKADMSNAKKILERLRRYVIPFLSLC